CRFGRLHLLRTDRRGIVHLPPTRRRSSGEFQGAAASVHDGSVRRRLHRHRRRDRPQQSGEQPDRLCHPDRRCPRMPVLAAAQGSAGPMIPPRTMQSDYMHWAKFKGPVRYALTGSEVEHFHLDRLGVSIDDLDMDGASHPRYAPLRERIARRYGVGVENVVAADGTSMANFLALATLISPGDDVLIEHPSYDPILGAASFLGASIRRFERNPSDAFRLDPSTVEKQLNPKTRLIVITNLHNPSGNLAQEAELAALGQLAAEAGARVLIDEVYLDAAGARTAFHLGPQFVCTNSLTKVYGLSGLRCGWILAEPELAERMWRLNDLFGVNQAHQAERLACIAFDRIDEVI